MRRMILLPMLLVSGLALAQNPRPTPPTSPPPPTNPTPPAGTPGTPTGTVKITFKELDKNNDKALEKSELTAMPDMTRDFEKIDVDKNGKISEVEYDAWIAKPGAPTAMFKDLDKNGDKVLEKSEISSMPELSRDFAVVDIDKNGSLSEAEYTAWVAKQKPM